MREERGDKVLRSMRASRQRREETLRDEAPLRRTVEVRESEKGHWPLERPFLKRAAKDGGLELAETSSP